MFALARAWLRKSVAMLLVYSMTLAGCRPGATLDPSPGAPDYESPAFVAVPGARVDATDGNLLIERSDIETDTALGTQVIGASYNSSTGQWLWNFDAHYDGDRFVDASGAVHPVAALADGDPIEGTVWTRVDADTIETRGGLAHHFDASGRLESLRWSTLDFPRIQYRWTQAAGVDRLEIEQCTQPAACSDVFVVGFDEGGAPVSVDDARSGRRVEYTYDAGRLVRVRDPVAIAEGHVGTRYEYAPLLPTLLTAIVDAEGSRIEYAYQANRRVSQVRQIGEGNPTHRFAFHAPSSSTFDLYSSIHTNPLGGETRYLFDAARRVHGIRLVATGETAWLAWTGLRATSIGTAWGGTFSLTYVDDSLVERIDPAGNVVSIAYASGAINRADPRSRPIARIDDSLGPVAEFGYDAMGRLDSVANGAGEQGSFAYHAGSALAASTDPAGVTDSYPIYGAHGHWLDRDGASPDHRVLDAVGNVQVASVVLDRGGYLFRAYDAARNLSRLDLAATDALGHVSALGSISIARRADGQIRYVARPGGGDHSLAYDALGRLVGIDERVDGQWQATRLEYAASGQISARERPNGMREELLYDRYGRLAARRALRSGELEGVLLYARSDGLVSAIYDSVRDATESYAYDAAGRLVATHFGSGEISTREYDVRSRLVGERFAVPGAGTVADIGYVYDAADRRVRSVDRLSAQTLEEHAFVDGRLAATTSGNGLVRSYVYDPVTAERISSSTVDALGTALETTTIERSTQLDPPRQQLRAVTDTPLAQTEEQYWFGLGGSLASLDQRVGKRVFGWNDGAGAETFAYDELGNRIGDASGNAFVYNAERNRLLSASVAISGETLDYTYDAAGFVTSRNGEPIGWTAAGRLASHGGDRLEWDMQGRLIAAEVAGLERAFGWFGGRVAGDPSTGTLGSLDVGGASIQLASGERVYRHLDFRGNVSFVSDDSGQITSHYRYAPYGVDAVFGTGEAPSTFVDRAEFGELMLLGYRVYDPCIGRFLSPDPVFQLVNQYAYTLGNPIAYSDADGLDSEQSGSLIKDKGAAVEAGADALGLVLAVAAVVAEGAPVTLIGAVSLGFGLGAVGFFLALALARALGGTFRGGAIRPRVGAPRGVGCGLLGFECVPFLAWWFGRIERRRRRRGVR